MNRGRNAVERLSRPRKPKINDVQMFQMPNRLEESLRLGKKVDLDDLAHKIA